MKLLSTTLFLILFPALACATIENDSDESHSFLEDAHIRPYISLKVGSNHNKIKISEIQNKEFKNNTASINPAFGFQFDASTLNRLSFRLEAEYFQNSSGSNSYSSKTSWDTGLQNPYITHHYQTRKDTIKTNANGVLFNAYLDINTPFVKPFLVAGLGYGKLTQENLWVIDTVNDSWNSAYDSTEHVSDSDKHSTSNIFYQLGLGISINLTTSISINAEYRHVNYGSITVYTSKLDLTTNQLLIGARYRF
ncbi:MAG: porin family protein [Alphaproteobacteria bacterium]|nr:porin family protein [Alphaproteobacteria bacterium]